jgi:hypothetical protein
VTDQLEPDENLSRKVTDWLFLLLRFAITHHECDRIAVSALAQQMDSLGRRHVSVDRGFFQRTSIDLCEAIVAPGNPRSFGLLRTHALRIEHPRLRDCFRAAVDLAEAARATAKKRSGRQDLWRGLRSSCAADQLRR